MDKKPLKDHRQIGQEQELFTVSGHVGGGLPLFTPKGTILRKLIHDFIEDLQKDLKHYKEVWIPHMAKPELYRRSGHLEKYPEYFKVESSVNEDAPWFILKPMNCPHHMEIFRSRPRSYRELPLAYKEFTTNYRDEQSGELNGLLRVRSLTIDDCHIFCTDEQIFEESLKVYKTIIDFYEAFNFKVKVRLSFRDTNNKDKYIGDDEAWNKAEDVIKKLSREVKFETYEAIGEAAFYGPKIDFMIKDILDREWQLATIQLDYIIPGRLGLEYVGADGEKKVPIVIHRAIAGSVERFIGILIEQYQGAFPVWLAPIQVVLIPISEKNNEYARKVALNLKQIRVEVDDRSETMQSKIRDAQVQKVPYMLIVGGREEEKNQVSVRTRDGKDLGVMQVEEFLEKIKKEVELKSS